MKRDSSRQRAQRRIAYYTERSAQALLDMGVPPEFTGFRGIRREAPPDYVRRRGLGSQLRVVHEADRAIHSLPENIRDLQELPGDAGWWGYAFNDVPNRMSHSTYLATLPDCRISWYFDERLGGDFFPAILTQDGRGLDLREIRFRERHVKAFRAARNYNVRERGVWFAERVYDNHSHWLTAHLPKLLLLRRFGLDRQIFMPEKRTPVMNASLKMLGYEDGDFQQFSFDRPLRVKHLTVVGTDRFRPELVRLVPEALGVSDAPAGSRRIFISRAGAERRRLLNEDELWPVLNAHGFERIRMEDLTFSQQVDLMRQTAVLCAPHGAGLTNMMFCPPGTHIVEMADPAFPNPNFYALAAALGHRYWYVKATSVGEMHPLEKDLQAAPGDLQSALESAAA